MSLLWFWLFRSPGIRVLNFHGGSRRDRERVLLKVSRRGGVCLTSYGMLVNNADQLATIEGKEFKWVGDTSRAQS